MKKNPESKAFLLYCFISKQYSRQKKQQNSTKIRQFLTKNFGDNNKNDFHLWKIFIEG